MSKIYLHIRQVHAPLNRLSQFLLLVTMALLVSACATSNPATTNTIDVEGTVSVRGNEPFTELVLQTRDSNYYVLKFATPDERARMQNMAPASFSVSGEVYRDVWGSRAFAHLRVHSWTPSTDN